MGIKNSLSFMMPMYNESDNIERTVTVLRSIAASLTDDFEIVVVDDASQDASASIVRDMAERDKKIKLYRLEENTKFGGAFAEGFKRASKDIVVYMDSDMPVAPQDITASLHIIEDADIVTAVSSVEKGDTTFRKFVSFVYNTLVRALFKLDIRDINSGYKIVRRSLVSDAAFISRSPFVDTELFLHALKKKARIKQYPVIFLSRSGGKSHIASFSMIAATFRDMVKVWIRHRRTK